MRVTLSVLSSFGTAAGTVCVWVASTGKLRFRFTRAHSDHRITAMTLDSNCRRLLTGADNGQLKMWNFSSGACIKTMNPKGAGMEVTGITCTQVVHLLSSYHPITPTQPPL
jgi:WD40 repeat protein